MSYDNGNSKENRNRAFPCESADGLVTLRDYFAVRISESLVSANLVQGILHPDAMPSIAKQSYQMAEAMLEARK